MSTQSKWVYSGEQLHDVSEQSLYLSRAVAEYVSDTRKLILLSSKGMGKTHLLRRKRNLLAGDASASGALFIPSSSGSDVDRQTYLPKNMGSEHWAGISLHDWAALWEISIALSVLLNYAPRQQRLRELDEKLGEVADKGEVPSSIGMLIYQRLDGLVPALANPTYILNALLSLTASKRQKVLRASQNSILQLYPRFISSAVFVFIDSFDQTLAETENGNIDLWVNGQAGLALASYNLFVNCSHLKVFTSIRQEAWTKLRHENKNVVESFSTTLRYTPHELRSMLDHLSGLYEGLPRLADVFNLPKAGRVRNRRLQIDDALPVEEDLFDYLFRHSAETPRSLVQIVSSVTSHCNMSSLPDDFQKQLRKEVNLNSGSIAKTRIESEMALFLGFLSRPEARETFFSSIRRNVLSRRDVENVSALLSNPAAQVHPFCELYNLGLLGAVVPDVDGDKVQYFRSPLDFDWNLEHSLPMSEYYLLHPSLEAHLSEKYRLEIEPGIVVQPGATWPDNWDSVLSGRTLRIFISYSTRDRALKDSIVNMISTVLNADAIRHEYWVDHRKISASDVIGEQISSGIMWADVMVSLVTPRYLDSKWCVSEFRAMETLSMSSERCVMPFILEGANRESLGVFASSRLVPSVDDEPASLISIGQEVRAFWRKRAAQASRV
ncbi:MAG: toll/interleukin-1 receptor domain-containing protein [Paracoccaceae bacterium]